MDDEEFHGIDLLFARHHCKEREGQKLLARLLRSVREGELFLPLLSTKLPELPDDVVVVENGRLYLQRHYALRSRFYADLERICRAPLAKKVEGIEVDGLEGAQAEALIGCQKSPFWIVTGGPGTGKSYTLARLISQFAKHLSVVVTAPTGKATARMRELLPNGNYEACTLHKLLGVMRTTTKQALSHDLIVVDECSMVDVTLFTKLVSMVQSGVRLLLVGDHEQLPPVEGASYFKELVENKSDYVTKLTHSHRIENEKLHTLIQKAKRGETLPTETLPRPEKLVAELEKRLLFTKGDSFAKSTAFKLLTPLRKGPYGVEQLNRRFYERQKELYPEAPIPIMITVNEERFGLYNGDLALLHNDEVHFAEGRKLPLACVRAYELGFVLSVHKSQGSEYEEVLLILPPGSERFGPEMTYTAITRAKKRALIWR